MIDFYTAATPNGRKVALMLTELGLEYKEHLIDLTANQQKEPGFLAMNPNGKIPVIVDHEGATKTAISESAAILYYLAEKHGQFIGKTLQEKTVTMQWVMFQMSAIGPIFGNYYYGKNSLQPYNPGYIERFEKEANRLLGVMEIHLQKNDYLAGSNYSIADMCTYPWLIGFVKSNPEWFAGKPAVHRWVARIGERPAVKKICS
ncbi:MAG: glutathione S-transferase N-terminal domain-containing protein [Bdellovibrio sp.]|nr:glutathione S-transferase N-terminal domain-containing protein [Bdellovibrio sp.]